MNKLPIAHNLFSLTVHIQKEGEMQLQREQALAQGAHYRQHIQAAGGPYPRFLSTGVNICLGWWESSSNTKLWPNILWKFLGCFHPVFCKLPPNSHYVLYSGHVICSEVTSLGNVFHILLYSWRKAGTNSDIHIGPVTHVSDGMSLPSYFWFQGQVIEAGISSVCLQPGHSTHTNSLVPFSFFSSHHSFPRTPLKHTTGL